MKFETAVAFILGVEGGYVNDPADPGGETNFGISKRSYPNLDIAHLTKEDATGIYRADYWNRLYCDELPHGLDFLMLDCGVNQGTSTAAHLLQASLGVTQDGIIGPATIKAAQNNPGIASEFLARRSVAYANNPLVSRDGLGWFRRLAAAARLAFQQ